jgi:hypothetical protein
MSLILDTNAVSAIAEGERGASKQFIQARQVAIKDGLDEEVYRDVKEHGEFLCLGFADGPLTAEYLGDSALGT